MNSKRYRSADEVKAEFVQCFPGGAGELACELSWSITHLHLKWKHYRSLFATSMERIDLLNRAAPALFRWLETIMRNDVVLAITRLTDPPRTGKHANASLERLVELIEPHVVDSVALAGWKSDLAVLKTAVEPLRDLRNRFLAHDNMATALDYHPLPPPGFSRADVEALLERIRGLFESIEEKFCGSHTPHESVDAQGGEQLIASLERAVGGHTEPVKR